MQNECPKYLKIVLPALYNCLKDRDDDVRAVSASAMLPVTDIIVNMEPNQVIHVICIYAINSLSCFTPFRIESPIGPCLGQRSMNHLFSLYDTGSYVRIFLCSQAGLEIRNSKCQRIVNGPKVLSGIVMPEHPVSQSLQCKVFFDKC